MCSKQGYPNRIHVIIMCSPSSELPPVHQNLFEVDGLKLNIRRITSIVTNSEKTQQGQNSWEIFGSAVLVLIKRVVLGLEPDPPHVLHRSLFLGLWTSSRESILTTTAA